MKINRNWIDSIENGILNKLPKKDLNINKIPDELENKILNIVKSSDIKSNKRNSFIMDFFNNFRILKYAIAFVVIIGLFFAGININKYFRNNYNAVIISKTGEVNVNENGNKSDSKTLAKNNFIVTGANSDCTVKLGITGKVSIKEKSNIKINTMTLNDNVDIDLSVNDGEALFDINKLDKNSHFVIRTGKIIVSIIGTRFLIRSISNDKSLVSVFQGKVGISINDENNNFNQIILDEGNEFEIENNNYKINKIMDITLKKLPEKQNLSENYEITKKEENEYFSNIKKIYDYNNDDDPSNSKILGFAFSDKYVIAQTMTSIICFDYNGNFIWEKKYGEKRKLLFMSLPFIDNNKIYSSSLNNKLVIIDLMTSKEINVIPSQGNVLYGHTIISYKDKLYFPLTDGIQSFDTEKNKFIEKLLIVNSGSVSPLIINDKIYISSYVNKNLNAYDLEGNNLWSFTMDNRSYNIPVFFKNSLFIGDCNGAIYKIDLNGKLIKKIMLPSGIISCIKTGYDRLFVLANNGFIYEIKCDTLNYKKLFQVDENIDDSIYVYKSLFIDKNIILAGSSNGTIICYDILKEKIETNNKISDYPISCSIYKPGSKFFAGDYNGQIFLGE